MWILVNYLNFSVQYPISLCVFNIGMVHPISMVFNVLSDKAIFSHLKIIVSGMLEELAYIEGY